MEIDPHTIQQILTKVRDQLRCPQCRKKVDVEFDSLKVLGDSFAVLQLRCSVCDAYIMLHATLSAEVVKGINDKTIDPSKILELSEESKHGSKNYSSKLLIDADEMKALQDSIQKANGSFGKLFDTL